MNKWYKIHSHVGVSWPHEAVEEIIKKAEKIGCSFYFTDFNETDPLKYRKLSSYEAEAALLFAFRGVDPKIITLKYEDTFIDMALQEYYLGTCITFLNFRYPWYAVINDVQTTELDMVRYTGLMLDIIEGFPFIDLHLEEIMKNSLLNCM